VNIFRTTDYREIIKGLITNRKKTDPTFTAATLAQQIGVQKTYVSMVLRGEREFSSDQVFQICQEFQLNSEITDYILLLLEYARTGLAVRKKELHRRIGAIQLEQQNLKKHIKRKVIVPEPTDPLIAEYYLDPWTVIVHHFLIIPKYQKTPNLIRQKLGLTQTQMKTYLARLQKVGLIKLDSSGRIHEVSHESVHLSRNSPLCAPHLSLLRHITGIHLDKILLTKRLSYSSVFRANESTIGRIQDKLTGFLKEIEPMLESAPDEEVFGFNFDLFPWALD
jgi:uncharacterized protein (TIGR02147 family)